MFRNILVCVDQSPQSDVTLAQAIDLADCQHSRLTILTAVIQPPGWVNTSITAAGGAPRAPALARDARAPLERAVRRGPAGSPGPHILSEEPIREALTARLKNADHDLVVLGTHSRGALAASLHRSVSHFALRHCQIPVLTVRAEGEAEPEPRERRLAAVAAA